MEQPVTSEKDLIFTILGGHRHGAQIRVKACKSILALGDGDEKEGNEQSLCAIFRGPAGTVIRNLDDEILVNGQPKTTHWLETGDLIQFSNSVTLQVSNLGVIQENEESQEPNFATAATAEELTQAAEDDNQDSNSQFDILSKRIDQLAEQISGLVSLASVGQFPMSENASKMPETDSYRNASRPSQPFTSPDLLKPIDDISTQENLATSVETSPKPPSAENFAGFFDQFDVNESVSSASDSTSFFQEESCEDVEAPTHKAENTGTDEALDDLLKRLFEENSKAQDADAAAEDQPTAEKAADGNLLTTFEPDNTPSPDHFGDQPKFADSNRSNSKTEPFSRHLEPTKTDDLYFECDSTSDAEIQSRSLAEQLLTEFCSETKQAENSIEQPDVNSSAAPIHESLLSVDESIPVTSSNSPGSNVGDESSHGSDVTHGETVEDYMNQLLARMNFGSEVKNQTPQLSHQPMKQPILEPVEEVDGETEEHKFMEPDEFVPRRKAPKIESLSTMRDIANTTARNAIAYSDYSRKKTRCLMQLIIAIGAAIMAIYYFVAIMGSLGDTAFWIGSVCFIISGVLCFLSFRTLAKQQSMFEFMFQGTEKNEIPNGANGPIEVE